MVESYKDEQTLRQLYHGRGLTIKEVASEVNCAYSTVHRYMEKFGIERRDDKPEPEYEELQDESWLREKYATEGKSVREIAAIIGCGDRTVKRWLKKQGIQTRPPHPVTDDKRVYDSEWMETQYTEKGLSAEEIAGKASTGKTTIFRWLRKHGIEVHPRDASGEDHYRWKGGWDHYYGPDWNQQRQKRRERDDNKCVVCGLSNGEHKERTGKSLHVHHIQRKESFRDEEGEIDFERANRMENLITLCETCHNRWEGIPLRPQYE